MSLVPQPLKTGSLYRQAAYNYNRVNDKKGKNKGMPGTVHILADLFTGLVLKY